MSDTEIYKQIREYKDQNAIDEILKQIEDGSIDVNHVLNLRHRSIEIENVSLFSHALEYDRKDIVIKLLEKGIDNEDFYPLSDLHGGNELESAITRCSADIFKKILDFYQTTGKIRELVSAQNVRGETALMSKIMDIIFLDATESPANTNINQLLELPKEVVKSFIDMENKHGETALSYVIKNASKYRIQGWIEQLVSHGAKVDLKTVMIDFRRIEGLRDDIGVGLRNNSELREKVIEQLLSQLENPEDVDPDVFELFKKAIVLGGCFFGNKQNGELRTLPLSDCIYKYIENPGLLNSEMLYDIWGSFREHSKDIGRNLKNSGEKKVEFIKLFLKCASVHELDLDLQTLSQSEGRHESLLFNMIEEDLGECISDFFGKDKPKLDINGRDEETGMTALMHAVREGKTQAVDKLVESGAEMGLTDNEQRSVFDHLTYCIKRSRYQENKYLMVESLVEAISTNGDENTRQCLFLALLGAMLKNESYDSKMYDLLLKKMSKHENSQYCFDEGLRMLLSGKNKKSLLTRALPLIKCGADIGILSTYKEDKRPYDQTLLMQFADICSTDIPFVFDIEVDRDQLLADFNVITEKSAEKGIIDSKDSLGNTALAIFCRGLQIYGPSLRLHNSYPYIQKLIDSGADIFASFTEPSKENESALSLAVRSKDRDVFEIMKDEYKKKDGNPIVMDLIGRCKDDELTKYFLSEVRDTFDANMLERLFLSELQNSHNIFIDNVYGSETVKLLRELGDLDINEKDNTPLIIAARHGNTTVLNKLLDSVSIRDLISLDKLGRSAYDLILESENIVGKPNELFKSSIGLTPIEISRGRKPKYIKCSNDMKMLACAHKMISIDKRLLNKTDDAGNTLLMSLLNREVSDWSDKHQEMAESLIENGSDLMKKNKNGKNAYAIALEKRLFKSACNMLDRNAGLLNETDGDGNTFLMSVVCHGGELDYPQYFDQGSKGCERIDNLLEKKADIGIKNRANKDVYDLALDYSLYDLANKITSFDHLDNLILLALEEKKDIKAAKKSSSKYEFLMQAIRNHPEFTLAGFNQLCSRIDGSNNQGDFETEEEKSSADFLEELEEIRYEICLETLMDYDKELGHCLPKQKNYKYLYADMSGALHLFLPLGACSSGILTDNTCQLTHELRSACDGQIFNELYDFSRDIDVSIDRLSSLKEITTYSEKEQINHKIERLRNLKLSATKYQASDILKSMLNELRDTLASITKFPEQICSLLDKEDGNLYSMHLAPEEANMDAYVRTKNPVFALPREKNLVDGELQIDNSISKFRDELKSMLSNTEVKKPKSLKGRIIERLDDIMENCVIEDEEMKDAVNQFSLKNKSGVTKGNWVKKKQLRTEDENFVKLFFCLKQSVIEVFSEHKAEIEKRFEVLQERFEHGESAEEKGAILDKINNDRALLADIDLFLTQRLEEELIRIMDFVQYAVIDSDNPSSIVNCMFMKRYRNATDESLIPELIQWALFEGNRTAFYSQMKQNLKNEKLMSSESTEFVSCMIQFCLGVVSHYTKDKRILDGNIGAILEGNELLRSGLIDKIKNAISNGENIEKCIISYINAHHSEFGIERVLSSEDVVKIAQVFQDQSDVIQNHKEKDEFLTMGEHRMSNSSHGRWLNHAGCAVFCFSELLEWIPADSAEYDFYKQILKQFTEMETSSPTQLHPSSHGDMDLFLGDRALPSILGRWLLMIASEQSLALLEKIYQESDQIKTLANKYDITSCKLLLSSINGNESILSEDQFRDAFLSALENSKWSEAENLLNFQERIGLESDLTTSYITERKVQTRICEEIDKGSWEKVEKIINLMQKIEIQVALIDSIFPNNNYSLVGSLIETDKDREKLKRSFYRSIKVLSKSQFVYHIYLGVNQNNWKEVEKIIELAVKTKMIDKLLPKQFTMKNQLRSPASLLWQTKKGQDILLDKCSTENLATMNLNEMRSDLFSLITIASDPSIEETKQKEKWQLVSDMIEFAVKGKFIDEVVKNIADKDPRKRTIESILSETDSGREIISKHHISSTKTESEDSSVTMPRRQRLRLWDEAQHSPSRELSHTSNGGNSCMNFCQMLTRYLFPSTSRQQGP